VILIGVLLLVVNMVIATQYATTKNGYEYSIHSSDTNIRFVESDNTFYGRVLRVDRVNGAYGLKISLGNWSAGTTNIYSAAFGIVNEGDIAVKIMYINVSAVNYTYMRIWLHGDCSANANSDRTAVLMFNNGTIVNATNTAAWTLAPGDGDSRDIYNNVSNRNNSIGYGVGMFNRTISNASDFVWVQVAIDIPSTVDIAGLHAGTIWIYFEADS